MPNNFPQTFYGTPIVLVTVTGTYSGTVLTCRLDSTAITEIQALRMAQLAETNPLIFNCIAIGRWK